VNAGLDGRLDGMTSLPTINMTFGGLAAVRAIPAAARSEAMAESVKNSPSSSLKMEYSQVQPTPPVNHRPANEGYDSVIEVDDDDEDVVEKKEVDGKIGALLLLAMVRTTELLIFISLLWWFGGPTHHVAPTPAWMTFQNLCMFGLGLLHTERWNSRYTLEMMDQLCNYTTTYHLLTCHLLHSHRARYHLTNTRLTPSPLPHVPGGQTTLYPLSLGRPAFPRGVLQQRTQSSIVELGTAADVMKKHDGHAKVQYAVAIGVITLVGCIARLAVFRWDRE
jgi:hypothetical protein